MKLPTIKELVKDGNEAYFHRYFDGNLWYGVRHYTQGRDSIQTFEFPVPISDIGTATFLAADRAILFMRYIRKHLELLDKARTEQTEE